jgi:NDP-sugar pyrophosphorylase family protein
VAAPLPALLLTAGLGTRLDPLTRVRAKAAVPVAGVPLARRIVSWLTGQGHTDVTCNLHHLPHTITAALGDGGDLGARIRYSWEQPLVLGSAGGPRQALDIVGADTFLIVNGDTLTDVRIAEITDAHERSTAVVTLALVPNAEPHRYGGVLMDDRGAVTGFAPRGPRAIGSWHFIGVQVVQARAFSPVAAGVPAASIGGVYDHWIETEPGSVRGVALAADFMDIGSIADYRRTSARLNRGRADVGARPQIAGTARLDGSIIWDDVVIGAAVELDHCIVTDGVRVPDGAHFSNAVLLNDPQGHLSAIAIPDHP